MQKMRLRKGASKPVLNVDMDKPYDPVGEFGYRGTHGGNRPTQIIVGLILALVLFAAGYYGYTQMRQSAPATLSSSH